MVLEQGEGVREMLNTLSGVITGCLIVYGFWWFFTRASCADEKHVYDRWVQQAWTASFGRRAVFVMEHGEYGRPSTFVWEIWNTREVDLQYAVAVEVTSMIARSKKHYSTKADTKSEALREVYSRYRVVFQGQEWVREGAVAGG